jgi:hypothetical protein
MLLMDTLVEKLFRLWSNPSGILSRRKPEQAQDAPSRQVRRALERKKKSATGCK